MTISVRIICMDYYMATPGPFDRSYSPFCTKELSKVPIVRVFGSTLSGQKVCLHIHQVYPYFFIPYTIPEELKTEQQIQKNIFQFGTSLNEAMNIAKPNAEKDQHIVAIVLTRGIPFYGYHIGYQSYLKIYLANPYEKQQMLDLLQSEAIFGTRFQPHEAHLNFELQFLMDHNLYGMDWLYINEEQPLYPPTFRLPLLNDPKSSYLIDESSSSTIYSDNNITSPDTKSPFKPNFIYTSKTVPKEYQSDHTPRESYCELEMDITGMSIMNRLDLKERDIHVDLDTEKSIQNYALMNAEDESRKKMVKSLESIWKDEASRRKSRGITDPIPSVSQIYERDPHVPWIAETSLRKLMNKMMTERIDEDGKGDRSYLLSKVLTIFEAIEALYPEEYQNWKMQYLQRNATNMRDVDGESGITAFRASSPKSPYTPDISHLRTSTPPPSMPQKASSQFNITATPTRYSLWDVSTQLDKSIIDSLVRDPSFIEDRENDDENEEVNKDLNAEPVEDDDYFSQADHITDGNVGNWIEEAVKPSATHPTTVIEYAEEHPVSYRPRKLDFMSEAEKIDKLLQQERKTIAKKDFLKDMIESDEYASNDEIEAVSSVNTNEKIDDEVNDVEATTISISDVPPNPLPWPYQHRRKKRRIPQIDGLEDEDEDDTNKIVKQPSAAMKWGVEVETLQRMRKKARSKTEADNEKKKIDAIVDDVEDCELHRLNVHESESIFKTPTQSISTQAKVSTVTMSSSKNAEKVTLSKRKYPTTSSEQKNSSPYPNIETDITEQNKPSKDYELGDSGLSKINDINKFQSNSSNTDQIEVPFKKTHSSFFHKSVRLRPFVETNVSSQMRTLSRSNTLDTSQYSKNNVLSTKFTHREGHSYPLFKRDSSDQELLHELIYTRQPPKLLDLTFCRKGIIYKEPYYSKPSDLPRYPTVFAGKEFNLPTNGISCLKDFITGVGCKETNNEKLQKFTKIRAWSPIIEPPSINEVKEWAVENDSRKRHIKNSSTQLDKPTAENTYGFKVSATKPQAKVRRIRDYIDYFSLEIHVNTRGELRPDPQRDPVQLIFWCLQTEDQHILSNGYQEGYHVGVIALREFDIQKLGISNTRAVIDYADSEEQMFINLIDKIRHYDPDMLTGYEVQNASWGYLVERGVELGIHLLDELSRVMVISETVKKDQWGSHNTSSYKVCGRHMLNIWRLMKGEIALTSYTFENIAFHLLRDRVPHFSYETLTTWYSKGPAVLKYRLFKYYLKRVQMNLDILDASQVVTRACESARVYGIDFYSVFSRGSQYKVESIMFRIAKPENFVLITPNRKQVASQRSLECLPLIMEPISQFYSSPMVVLDFQSLYPSIMIAYNYCYSTCLGRVRNLEESSRFGVQADFSLPEGLLNSLKDHINVSPNGVMFVKPEIRKSLLAKMLAELLDTRVMIKRAMKDYKDDSGLLRMLDAKQLTLKLLANVTYGYTSASFSGRMPSVEIADSIVSTGRETLERTIRLINSTERWGARVVYGDTDSVFIYFPGKSKDEAFILGNEIADTVTKMNPAPIKLKFEKVFHPAVLLAKKRYVGFKYESRNDNEPVFEAKGIETVRRDGTAATQKIMESCLKILFRTQDMSELKEFLYKQWTKILSDRVFIQDFIISKEVKMGSYAGQGPNGAQIAQAQMNEDIRAEPQYGERVPYVVVYRGPGARLKDKVVRPQDYLADDTLRLDAEYYIRKQIISPLSRVFNLMGVDIESWYDSMPRAQKADALAFAQVNQPQNQKVTRIDQYYASSHCIVCRKITDQNICEQCSKVPSGTTFTLLTRQQKAQKKFRRVLQTCQNCTKLSPLDAMTVSNEENEERYADIPCNSLDCPTFYQRHKAKKDVKATQAYNTILDNISF